MNSSDPIILQEHGDPVRLDGQKSGYEALSSDDVEWLQNFTKKRRQGEADIPDVLFCLNADRSTAFDDDTKPREHLGRRIAFGSANGTQTLKAKNVCGWLALPSGRQIVIRSKLAAFGSDQTQRPAFSHEIGLHWLIAKAAGIRSDHYPLPTQHNNDRAWDYPLLPLIHLFADATDSLMRQGLHRFYVEEEETGPRIRGRLLVSATMLHHGRGRPDIATCVADDLTANVFENRVLLTALNAAKCLVRGLDVANSEYGNRVATTLNRLSWDLESEVTPFRVPGRTLAHDIRSRLRNLPWSLDRYRLPLKWAAIILDLLNPDSGQDNEFPAMLIDMPRLYEEGLRAALDGSPPIGHDAIEFKSQANEPYSSVKLRPRSDIEGDGWIADAKYYSKPLLKTKRSYSPHASHVYQAAFYALGYDKPVALVYAWGPKSESLPNRKTGKSPGIIRKSFPYVWKGTAKDLGARGEAATKPLVVGIFVMDLTTSEESKIDPLEELDDKAEKLRTSLAALTISTKD